MGFRTVNNKLIKKKSCEKFSDEEYGFAHRSLHDNKI